MREQRKKRAVEKRQVASKTLKRATAHCSRYADEKEENLEDSLLLSSKKRKKGAIRRASTAQDTQKDYNLHLKSGTYANNKNSKAR